MSGVHSPTDCEWIVQAKKPETRAVRIATTTELAQRNERANQWKPKAR